MKNLDTFCRYCSHLTTRQIDDSFYAEYGSESKTHSIIYDINWCELDVAICPHNILDCPLLKNIELPKPCVNCSEIADCITVIECRGLQGLEDCEFSEVKK